MGLVVEDGGGVWLMVVLYSFAGIAGRRGYGHQKREAQ